MCAVFLSSIRLERTRSHSGQPVYFDKTGITDAADNGETSGSKVAYTPAGFAAKAAAAGDAKVLVKIG